MNWSANCVIIYTNVNNQVPTSTITERNLYAPVVTLSTQDNEKLLPQLKSGFKRKISWNKYLAKPELLTQNANLNYLIEPSFQGVNRLFVLAFEHDNDNDQRISNQRYYIPKVEIKNYNVMIDGKIFSDQPVKNDKVTYENILKNYYWSRRLLYNWFFVRLYLFQKTLQNDCSRFKQIASSRC